MERLLKIVEGPMKGAEAALVVGTRIKVGRGEDCDIVIDDASLAETAFELDVAEAAVTLITPDGTAREMRPFEIHDFGTTSVALGPAEGRWESLRPAVREAPPEESAQPTPEPAAENPEPAASAEKPAADDVKRRKGGCAGMGCLTVVLLVLIALALVWFFRQALVERYPQAKPSVERVESWVAGLTAKLTAAREPVPEKVVPTVNLRDLAAQHGVSYAERDGVPVLAGNLAHRTERLAIRALALAADRRCVLDLSDDETLASSADALLFTVTEGALKLAAASNRTVVLSGYAPTAVALGDALKALRADVPWAGEVDVAAVTVGGPVPAGQANNAFAVSGVLAGARMDDARDQKASATAESAGSAAPAETDIRISDVNGRKLPRGLFPVAGILTRPYPCVVLRDGHRIVEGGQLGTYTVVRIGADALELKQGAGKANWEP